MSLSEKEIEELLKTAPKPAPPQSLQGKLLQQVHLPAGSGSGVERDFSGSRISAWKRWGMILIPAAVCLACMVVVAVQQMEIQDLRGSIDTLSTPEGELAVEKPPVAKASPAAAVVATASRNDPATEMERLGALISKLRSEISTLERVQKENSDLRKQLATRETAAVSVEEQAAMEEARQKAQSVRCVNNLKQMGLAVRVWALDNNDVFPPDIVCMSNELSTPIILVCPSDSGRVAAKDFNSFTMANFSYDFLAPNAKGYEPDRVLFRCPIHGHIGLCDGSVLSGVAASHPEWLVQNGDKLYMRRVLPPVNSPQPPGNQ